MNNSIQILKEIPSKKEIGVFVNDFISNGNNHLEKYLTLKFLEQVIKEALPKLNGLAKDDFLQTYNGVTKQETMGVEISLVNMSKSNMLKDPIYTYSDNVYNLINDIEKMEQSIKDKKDLLKSLKVMEINDGTAKKEELFDEPKEVKDDFQLKITLRK